MKPAFHRPKYYWLNLVLVMTLLGSLLPPLPAAANDLRRSETQEKSPTIPVFTPKPSGLKAANSAALTLTPDVELETFPQRPLIAPFVQPATPPLNSIQATQTFTSPPSNLPPLDSVNGPSESWAASSSFTPAPHCDNFSSGLGGWFTVFSSNAALSNPAGVMRLAASAQPADITVKKTLTGYTGPVNISSVFTSTSPTSLYFWVEYSNGSSYYMFSEGTTLGSVQTYYVNYTVPSGLVPVALNFRAAVNSNPDFGPFRVDVDFVCVTQPLPNDQSMTKGNCPVSSCGEQQHFAGDPINTFSGNYSYQNTDISVAAVGQPLKLERTYNSLPVTGTLVYSKPLGYGWSHNYDIRLVFPADPGGETGKVIFKGASGSRLRFTDDGSGGYGAYPGVWATLTRTLTTPYVYTMTAANQTTYVFTNTGRVTKMLDPQGNQTTLAYTSGITLSRVTDVVSGRYLSFSYDSQSRLTSVTDHTGRIVRYGYDLNNNLTVMTDTRSLRWTYGYTSANGSLNYLHAITDPDGKTVSKTFFDSQGRATQQWDGLNQPIIQISYPTTYTRVVTEAGKVLTDTYNELNLLTNQVDALSQALTYTFDSSFNRDSNADANGNPPALYDRTPMGLTTGITDALGQATSFGYDARNNLTQTVDARGTATNYTYDAQNNLKTATTVSGTTTYTYNTAGQVTAMTDENNRTTQYGYDSLGQRTVITDATQAQTTRYGYDNLGRVITITDALNKVTQNQYDGAGNLTKTTENYLAGQPQNYQNTYNLITSYAYDGVGRQTLITDTLGRVTKNDYDAAGRLFMVTENRLSGQAQNYQNTYNIITTYGYDSFGRQNALTDTLGNVTRTFYDAAGRVDSTVLNYASSINGGHFDPASPDRNIETKYVYDKNGNVLQTILLPGPQGQQRITCTVYDELNRMKQTIENCINGVHDGGDGPDQDIVTSYQYDSVGNQTTITAPLNRITRYGYDALNRVITTTNPLGGLTSYSYDRVGNRTQITNPQLQITTYQYDALNRVVTTTNALGGQTIVTYDQVGNQKKIVDANTNALTYTYDSMYRLTGTTDAENQTFSYTYDALGNKLTQSDPLSRVTRYEYDSLNRLITTTQNYISGGAANASTNVRTVYTYDALSNRTSLKDPNSNTTNYTFDKLNHLTQIVNPKSSIVNGYDGLGNRVSLTNGLTQTTVYTYDGLNRLSGMRSPLSLITTYTYNEAGERTAMLDPTGVKTSYEYDALSRLTAVIENDVASPSGSDQDVTTRYGYDAVGNRTVITNANLQITTYQYDALNRLTSVTDPAPLSFITRYGYDAVGNRKVITDANSAVTLYNYDKVYRLTGLDYPASMTDVSFSYDKLGNKLTMIDASGTTTYTYDSLYRLTQVSQPSAVGGPPSVVAYGYDAAGNRNQLTYPDNKVITYTYDTANRLFTAQDWSSGRYTYTYDAADRLVNVGMANGVTSTYSYDADGRLTRLAHTVITGELAIYDYSLDAAGNRKRITETLVIPTGTPPPLSFRSMPPLTSPLNLTPTLDITNPLTTPDGPLNPERSTLYLPLLLKGSGSTSPPSTPAAGTPSATSEPPTSEPPTSNLPRSTLYFPILYGFDDSLSAAALTGTGITRTIVYTYDKLYRLTDATYSSGEVYAYSYDQAGNRRSQNALGQTTVYTYDNANRIANANTQAYTWSNTGNLLNTGLLTNTFDAANRLTAATRLTTTLAITYDGLNNRVRQTIGTSTTTYALDAASALPEVISTTNGTAYLHLPGLVLAQNSAGQRVVLLPDGLGSVRQIISGTGVIAWRDYDPYGQVRQNDAFTDTFTSSLEGWSAYSYYANPGLLSNPPGVMRLSSPGNPSGITVRKPLSGAPGALTISSVFTVASYTTVHFWVEYADSSLDYVFANGTTPPGTYGPSYTTPATKTAIALYFYAAASGGFPPYQVDVDTISVVPASTSTFSPPPYAFTGEWWEQDVRLLHLRARWYDPGNGVFLSKDPWPGDGQRPQSLNGWSYVEGNPVNRTDPSGFSPAFSDPATACMSMPSCAALVTSLGGLGAPAIASITINPAGLLVVTVVGLVGINVYLCGWQGCAVQSPIQPQPAPAPPIFPPIPGGTPVPESPTGTGENPFRLPPIYQAPKTQSGVTPEPKPNPSPYRIPAPPETCTPESHQFYFKDVGTFYNPVGYPPLGRATVAIITDLRRYNNPGMLGAIGQLTGAQALFNSNNGAAWTENILMGRKFEAERAIFFASRNALERMNSTAEGYDLIPMNFDPIKYIQVKWSRGSIPASTISKVAIEAKLHPSGTYLLESNNIGIDALMLLQQNGGVELQLPYP